MKSVDRLLVRRKELAHILSVSERSISNFQKRRIIPVIRVGKIVLFNPSEVIQSLGKFRISPVGETTTGQASVKRRAGRLA
jgi:hypothetical protein